MSDIPVTIATGLEAAGSPPATLGLGARVGRRLRRWVRRVQIAAMVLLALALLVLTTLPSPSEIAAIIDHPFVILDPGVTDRAMHRPWEDFNYTLPVDLAELPPYIPAAFIAIEDRGFRDHWGVSLRGLARAAFVNLRAGRIAEGGSTITQQVAKNLFLVRSNGFLGKVRQAAVAVWLETLLDKDQILAAYLDVVPFGNGIFGLEAAARHYYHKRARELTLYEAAVLAGTIQSPDRRNPERDPEGSRARAARVLGAMVETGAIDRVEADAALAAPEQTGVRNWNPRSRDYLLDWIWPAARQAAGDAAADVYVSVTLDPALQLYAEMAVDRALRQGARYGVTQAAFVAMAPDGAVLAMVGGSSYQGFNRATQALRQPGSAFKPLVYLAALQAGWSPSDVIDGSPVIIDGWSPRNIDGRAHGPLTLHDALVRSVNTATVRLSEAIGRDNVAAMARALGLTRPLPDDPTLALGSGAVSLLELTAAYAVLANGGHAVEPYGFTMVRDRDGRVLYRHPDGLGPRVVAPELVDGLESMLRDVIDSPLGTGHAQVVAGMPDCAGCFAGKTGTSQGYRDAWFVGYSGELVAGVWLGNDDYATGMRGIAGGGLPAFAWANFMRNAYDSGDALYTPADRPPPLRPAADRSPADWRHLPWQG